MTTETDATVAAEATATATTTAAETPEVESQTTDEVEQETTDSGEGSEQQDSKDDEVQAKVDAATRKARRRIDRLLADRAQAQERAARLEAELAEAKKSPATDESGAKPKPTEDPREIARTMRLVEKTAEATAKVMKDAGKKYPDFDSAVAELVEELGPQIDKIGRPSPLMEAVLDSERAGDVLYHLGKNPEVAAELAGLSPARLGRRIAQIESDLAAAAKPKPSAAAKPLTPAKPSAAIVVDEKKLSDKEWFAARQKAKLAG